MLNPRVACSLQAQHLTKNCNLQFAEGLIFKEKGSSKARFYGMGLITKWGLIVRLVTLLSISLGSWLKILINPTVSAYGIIVVIK